LACVLVADGCSADRSALRKAVEQAGLFDRVLEAADGLRALRLLLAEPVDVVVCDLDLPQLDGEKLLRTRLESRAGEPCFLFVTASADPARCVRLLDLGAHDVIAKPYHSVELAARIARQLRLHRLQQELREKNSELARLSSVDALTGLRTRRYVQDLLSLELLRARRYRTQLVVLLIDLDEFKHLNDSHGHPAGDAVLRGVAERILRTLRATDTAGRWGGDELLVVLPQNHAQGAVIAAERWRQAVAAQPFELPDGRPVNATLSIGIAALAPAHATAADLVAAADRALYAAKRAGRNRVEVEG
jgi:two-component system cell cycle response regulator